MSYPVPVRNIYYLLCYAYDFLPEAGVVPRGIEEFTHPQDLLGGILARGIASQIKHGLDRNYIERQEELRGIRGKLNLSASLKTGRLKTGFAVCSYENLEVDILTNRLLKAAVRRLLRLSILHRQVRQDLERIWPSLIDIDDTGVSLRDFRSVQLHRNNRAYRFLLSIARMVFESCIADEQVTEGLQAESRFTDFRNDDARMGELFEAFVYNYYKRHAEGADISKPELQWQQVDSTDKARTYLPIMRTDMVVNYKLPEQHSLVADMKYYKSMLASRFGSEKLHSGHLFQLTAYLRNLRILHPARYWSGMLIYAVANQKTWLDYRIEGLPVHIRTLDLAREWQDIQKELNGMLKKETISFKIGTP